MNNPLITGPTHEIRGNVIALHSITLFGITCNVAFVFPKIANPKSNSEIKFGNFFSGINPLNLEFSYNHK